MTDNEIISIDEAIIHCYETYYERDDLCREFRDEHKQLAKWLEELKECRETINHQKAEIERLIEIANPKCQKCVSRTIECAKSEAIKEFAERLKSRFANLPVQTITHGRKTMPNYIDDIANQILHDVVPQEIDNLAKEMTEIETIQRKKYEKNG